MTVKETGRRGNVSGRFNIEAVMSDTVHVDDALDFMVRKLAEVPEDQPPNNRPSGYNVKILDIAADYWWQRNRTQLQNMHSPEVDPYYKPVCDATWRLCLMNVLRPGYASLTLKHFRIRLKSESAVIRDPPTSADSTRPEDALIHGPGFHGDGYSLTAFGYAWVRDAATRPTSDPSRFGSFFVNSRIDSGLVIVTELPRLCGVTRQAIISRAACWPAERLSPTYWPSRSPSQVMKLSAYRLQK